MYIFIYLRLISSEAITSLEHRRPMSLRAVVPGSRNRNQRQIITIILPLSIPSSSKGHNKIIMTERTGEH